MSLLMDTIVAALTILFLVIYSTVQSHIMASYSETPFLFVYLIFCNRTCTLVLSLLSAFIFDEGYFLPKQNLIYGQRPVVKHESIIANANSLLKNNLFCSCLVAFCNILATSCQYQSLVFIPLSLNSIGKCTKIIPTLLLRSLITRSLPLLVDVISSLLILSGTILTFLSPMLFEVYGLALIFLHSVFDSVTIVIQEKFIFSTALQRGYFSSIRASISVLVVQSTTGSLLSTLFFLIYLAKFGIFPSVPFHLVALLSLSSALSQLLILINIQRLSSVGHVLLMTLRHFLNILLSKFLLGQAALNVWQWIGVVLVLGSMVFRVTLCSRRRPHPQVDHPTKV